MAKPYVFPVLNLHNSRNSIMEHFKADYQTPEGMNNKLSQRKFLNYLCYREKSYEESHFFINQFH